MTDPFVALSVAATAAEDVELAHLARTARARGLKWSGKSRQYAK